ncbi:STAS domain-containing protein [Thermincola potens]|nr:STAS domain-containing protein [Thermincola potens]
MLQINRAETGETVQISLSGDLDISSVNIFRRCTDDLCSDAREIHFDLSGLEFIDSTGVGALAEMVDLLEGKGYKVKFTNITDDIYEILEIIGLPQWLGEEKFYRQNE